MVHCITWCGGCFYILPLLCYSGVAFIGAGYAKTGIVPTLKRVGKKEGMYMQYMLYTLYTCTLNVYSYIIIINVSLSDEVYMTSLSWVIPNLNLPDSESNSATSPINPQPIAPNINTCRPMSFQDEGAKVTTPTCTIL